MRMTKLLTRERNWKECKSKLIQKIMIRIIKLTKNNKKKKLMIKLRVKVKMSLRIKEE